MAKVIISFDKKHLYFLFFGILIIILFGFAMAYNPIYGAGGPADFGHSADEIMVNITGSFVTLENAISNGSLSSWIKSGSNIYYNGGKVGIGTTPNYKLDVDGTVHATGLATFDTNPLRCTSRTMSGNYNNPSYPGGLTAGCNADEKVTGGGCYINSASGATWVGNYPFGNGWHCLPGSGIINTAGTAYALCCKMNDIPS